MRCLLTLCLLLAMSSLMAQETGKTKRATALKAEARSEATTLGTLSEGSAVTVLSRGGGWARVQTPDKKTGWVNVFHLHFQGTVGESASGRSPIGAVASIFSGSKREPSKTISTVGVRGLSEEEMQNAKPNPAEFNKMKTYAASKPDAEAFARRSRLNSTTVAYVDARGRPIAGGEK